MAALLGEVGRGEVAGDAARRQGKADGRPRRAHPLAALAHRLVGQADDGEGRQARPHRHLDVDFQHFHALEGDGMDVRDHAGARSPLAAHSAAAATIAGGAAAGNRIRTWSIPGQSVTAGGGAVEQQRRAGAVDDIARGGVDDRPRHLGPAIEVVERRRTERPRHAALPVELVEGGVAEGPGGARAAVIAGMEDGASRRPRGAAGPGRSRRGQHGECKR